MDKQQLIELALEELIKSYQNKNNLVQVERFVHKNGKSFYQHFWVSPSDIKPSDKILGTNSAQEPTKSNLSASSIKSNFKSKVKSVKDNIQSLKVKVKSVFYQRKLNKFRKHYNLENPDDFLYALMKCDITWSYNPKHNEQEAIKAALIAMHNGVNLDEKYKNNSHLSYIKPANPNSELIDEEIQNFCDFKPVHKIFPILDKLGIKYDKKDPNSALKTIRDTISSGRALFLEKDAIEHNKTYTASPLEKDVYRFFISFNSETDAMKALNKLRNLPLPIKAFKETDDPYSIIYESYHSGIDLAKYWHQIQTNSIPNSFYDKIVTAFRQRNKLESNDDFNKALELLNIKDIKQTIKDGNIRKLEDELDTKTSTLKNLLSGKHWSAIQTSLSNVPEEYEQVRTLWKKYEDKFKTEIDTSIGFCYYYGNICFPGLNSIDTMTSLYATPYHVIFHEAGHAMDFRLGNEPLSFNYKGGIFDTTLRQETEAFLIKAGINDYSDKDSINHLQNLLDNLPLDGFQDVINGATDGRVCWGHSTQYWLSNKHNLCAEAFANLTSDILGNNTQALSLWKVHFPKSLKLYMEMVQELNKSSN